MQRPPMIVSKRSPIPLYYQLAERLRERIRAGELLKRRDFAAQFGRELEKLRQGRLAGD